MIPSLRRSTFAIVLAGCCIGALPSAAQQSSAPSQKATPAKAKTPAATKAAKPDPAAAHDAIEKGIAALANGHVDAAVTSLSSALSAGSLPQSQTARALYYRGVAYRRQNKTALAISDLTNALWIKGGLTDEQRADALQQRSGAFREAGLPDQGDPGKQNASGAKTSSSSTKFSSVAPPAPTGSSATVTGGGFFSSLFGGGSSSTEAPATSSAAPATTASVTPRAAPVAPAPQGAVNPDKPATRMVPVVSSGSSLPLGFQDVSEPFRQIEVSTQTRAAEPAPAPATASATPTAPASKSKAAQKQANTATAWATATQPAASAPPASAAGRLSIQVAAVRTPEEAQGVTSKLQSQFARELGGRNPVVDLVSAGNFGNFYRVQVGPFASARDTDDLCTKLKSGGLDCRIVHQ